MATPQDCSIGWSPEATYKTYVAPARWAEFISETLKWNKNVKNGAGLRVGSRVRRSTRRTVSSGSGAGDITMQMPTKGLGNLWTSALGTSTSTALATGFQQVHTFGDTPPALTIQKGTPRVDGTVDAFTFLGCMVDSWEIDSPNGEDVTVKFGIDAGDYTTAQSYVAPTYPSGANVFNFGQGAISIGTGALTAPTTTTLGSVASPLSGKLRSFNLQCNNNLAGDRLNYGNNGRKDKPTLGTREITGTFVAEYDATAYRDMFLGDTGAAAVVTFTGALLGGAISETFQAVVPEIRLNGDIPASNAGDLILVEHAFDGLDNTVAAQPLWLVQRTLDAAL